MMKQRLTVLALFAAAMSGGGCASEGGMGYSADRFVYRSHEWQPWTVSLVDTRTGESLWTVDVPVGRQLTLGFRQGAGPNEYKPDMMYWGLTENGRAISKKANQLPVPGWQSRRLEPVLRPTPELPGTPLPGSPYASLTSVEKTEAAAKGKVEPGVADLFAPSKPKAETPIPPPPAPEPVKPEESKEGEQAPVDLPETKPEG